MSIMIPQPQHNNPFRRHLQLGTSESLLSIAVAAAASSSVSSVPDEVLNEATIRVPRYVVDQKL